MTGGAYKFHIHRAYIIYGFTLCKRLSQGLCESINVLKQIKGVVNYSCVIFDVFANNK